MSESAAEQRNTAVTDRPARRTAQRPSHPCLEDLRTIDLLADLNDEQLASGRTPPSYRGADRLDDLT